VSEPASTGHPDLEETSVESIGQRSVLVTGAASGIGRATARAFADAGDEVIGVDRDQAGLDSLADEIPVRTLAVDLAEPEARRDLVDDVGTLDVVVNAAGIIRMTPIDEVTVEEWRLIHTVNAEAVFFLCQQLAPQIRPGGAIVNLASTAAKTGSTLEAATYAASKAAVLSVTRAFAFHLAGRNVTVNAVCPGVIDTPMQDQVLAGLAVTRGVDAADINRARLATVPLGRAARPEEVAEVIVWLGGPGARYLTAQAINVCGGLVTW
jgi:NAD(P)-dependent dehydrogenase (short-subunit alcohol dehydrogenase family)